MQSPSLRRRAHASTALLLTLILSAAGVSLPAGGALAATDTAIQGTVTSSGFPVWGLEVVAVPAGLDIRSDGPRASTSEDGSYALDGLEPGTEYSVRFDDPTGRFVSETAFGTPLYAVTEGHIEDTITVGATVDHDMTATGGLSGDVASLGGDRVNARVSAYTRVSGADGARWVLLSDTSTNGEGAFFLGGLDPRAPVRLVYADDSGNRLATSYGSGRVGGSTEALLDAGADVEVGEELEQQTLITAAERSAFVPRLDGAPRVGRAIALVNAPLGEYRAQWSAGGSRIAGATAAGFTPTAAQLGSVLTLSVTVFDVNSRVVTTETSAPTAPVVAGAFSGSVPTISGGDAKGVIRFGTVLTATARAWVPGTPALSYQWKIGGVDVAGAVSPTWKATAASVGRTVTVSVTARGPGYDPLTRTSAPTKAVAPANLTSPVPTISGKAVVGQTLTVTTGKWNNGVSLSYQWFADGRAMAGATRSSIGLGSSHVGKTITVRVTGKLAGYASITRTSAAVKIAPATLASPVPTVSGSARVGSTLTAKPGNWTAGTTLRYQWFLNGTAISRATSSTLTISDPGWKGKTVTVRVTGSKNGFTTIARTSARTAAISIPGQTAPSSTTSCPSWAPIKGNADSGIYHMPGQRYYKATHPEVCFSTESAARAGGFRKAKV